ncbi:peptide ABC transporter substrate-binding protein [Secundilactobacillus paracollinoides]|uniref:Peptide ABC transporter substrate-binding protein n=1 Tax=Secundilactobacillus paracollinoides TaxID=240427 RepID=A0A1B2IVN8_9LACO|nr:iron ABC transporter permease [Secundilactobacillus paracollinoides]ANZ62754.1 peptide ABC transporter substrate-binding protein [Secundilactobacillus paracollinoides]ANZ66088.1 peptide ABC transporter substrate-binding protein [Secundilactobacillus paracollinoides]
MTVNQSHRRGRIFTLGIITLIVLFIAALCIGRYPISLHDFYLATKTELSGADTYNPVITNIIFSLRLPRVTGACLIGAALAISGTAYQSIFQNPLVSPDLLGVSMGAAVGAALAILLGLGIVITQVFAFFFGLLAVFLSIMIPRLMRQTANLWLVLSGIIISGLMQAILGLLKYVADPESQLQDIVYWQLGSLSKVTMGNLLSVLPMFIIGAAVLMFMRWHLTVISLGEDSARAQGINVPLERNIVVICATFLTAGAVCLSGTIGWIGLIIPHIARMIIGPNVRYSLPLSGLVGAIFLLLVDTLARTLSAGEIPLSILTGFIGTPIFIYILLTKKVTV